MPLIEKLELRSPCTGVANIFIGDSLMVGGITSQGSRQPQNWRDQGSRQSPNWRDQGSRQPLNCRDQGSRQNCRTEEPLDWYLWPGGKTQQGLCILQDVLKKDRYRRTKQINIVFAFGHNDWRNYPAVSNILRNCSSLAKQRGARISFVAPLLPLREVLNATGCEWKKQWYEEFSEMKASIKYLNSQNGVVQNFYPYQAVIKNKTDWASDSYHFAPTQVNKIIQLIRSKSHKNSIFY